MLNLPTGPEDSIIRLRDDGYDLVLDRGHLVVRQLPYVAVSGLRKDGRLVLPVNDTDGVVTDANGSSHLVRRRGTLR